MPYKFTGLKDPPQYEHGLISKYNNTVLDELDGIRTLRLEGRACPKRGMDVINIKDSETDVLISSKFEPVKLTVIYLLEARTELAVPELLQTFLSVFRDHPGKLQFSDEGFYYESSLTASTVEGVGLTKRISCEFTCLSPYAFKDVEIVGPVFNRRTYYPVVPDKIEMRAEGASDHLEIWNPRTRSRIRVNHQINAGDTIIIEPLRNFGIHRGEQNLLPYLEPSSEFENLEMAFLDELHTTPAGSIRIWAKLKKLG